MIFVFTVVVAFASGLAVGACVVMKDANKAYERANDLLSFVLQGGKQ